MAFNLNDFRNKFVHGGARASQFEMQIVWPDAVRGVSGVAGAERDFRFLCHMSEIPANTIREIAVPYFGRKLKYAGEREYGKLSIGVYNDEDFKIRKAMDAWMKAICDYSTTISQFNGGITSGSYVTDGVVVQMSHNSGGSALHAYKFVGMFPTNLSAIALDWSSADEFEKFTIEFDYQWWEAVDASTGATI